MVEFSGRKLKQLRKLHDYSIREFADKIFTAKSSVQRWETSIVPNNEDLIAAIAEACNMSTKEVIEYLSENESTTTPVPETNTNDSVTIANQSKQDTVQSFLLTNGNETPTSNTSTHATITYDFDTECTAKQLKQTVNILLACGCIAVVTVLVMLILKFVDILT